MSDSSFHPHRSAPDPLGARLGALRAETDRCTLPPAGSIRRRGTRRSAVQIAGTTLAAASAIGIGAIVLPLGGAGGNGPVTPPTSSTSAPTTAPPSEQALGEVLITARDLPVEPGESAAWVVELEGGQTEAAVALTRSCGPIDDLGGLEAAARMFTNDGATFFAAHEVLLRASGDDAAEAEATDEAEAYAGYFEQCSGEGESPAVSRQWTLHGGPADGGRLIEVVHPETPDRPGSYEHVAIADIGRVVVIVSLAFEAQDESTTDAVRELLRIAFAGACTTTGAACTDVDVLAEPELLPEEEESSEEPAGPAPFLEVFELPTWDGLVPWDTASDIEDIAAGPYGTTCNPLWRDLGATSEVQRVYGVTTADPGDGPSASEVVATFPDEATATAAMAAVADAHASCVGRSDVSPDLTVETISANGPDQLAWLVTIDLSGSTPARTLVGIVRVGQQTAMVTVSYTLEEPLATEDFVDLLPSAAAWLELSGS